jgi:putative addiction module killer protein
MISLHEYLDASGRNEFRTWFNGLDVAAATKVTVALERLAGGNTSSIKPVGEGVSEYKIDFGPGYRIYFGKDGDAWWRHKETTEPRYRECQGRMARVQTAQEERTEASRGEGNGKE